MRIVRGLEPLRQVHRHRVRLLLVDAALEPVVRPVAPQAKREVGDGGAGVLAAGVVGLDQVEALAPRARRAARAARRRPRAQVLVGVEVHDPVAGGVLERDVAGVGERAVPREVRSPSRRTTRAISTVRSLEPVSTTIISSTTSRSGSRQPGEHLLLVLHDHAERERQAGDAAGPGRRPSPACRQAAHARAERALRAAAGCACGCSPARGSAAAYGRSGSSRRAALKRASAAARLEQLVEEDAGVVQERPARAARPRARRAGAAAAMTNGPDPAVRGRGPVGEHGFDDAAAGLVGAVGVVPLVELGERGRQAVEVAGRERGGGPATVCCTRMRQSSAGGGSGGGRREGGRAKRHRLRIRPIRSARFSRRHAFVAGRAELRPRSRHYTAHLSHRQICR